MSDITRELIRETRITRASGLSVVQAAWIAAAAAVAAGLAALYALNDVDGWAWAVPLLILVFFFLVRPGAPRIAPAVVTTPPAGGVELADHGN